MLDLNGIYQNICMSRQVGQSSSDYDASKCWVSRKGTVKWLRAAKFVSSCSRDNTWWPYGIVNCTVQFGSWSHTGDEIELISHQNAV